MKKENWIYYLLITIGLIVAIPLIGLGTYRYIEFDKSKQGLNMIMFGVIFFTLTLISSLMLMIKTVKFNNILKKQLKRKQKNDI